MSVLSGLGLDSLGVQFETAVPGRVLLLDGDAACYRASATCKTLDTAIRRFVKLTMEYMFLTNCSAVRIHLTAKGGAKCNRAWYPTVKPYQGNRNGSPKPPLLEPLRSAIAHYSSGAGVQIPPEWTVLLHDYWEADDGLIQDAYHYKDKGVLYSEDKDLRLTPYPYYEISTGITDYLPVGDTVGWLEKTYTDAGSLKIKGHGVKFFWWQMLAGDTADNIRGITKYKGKLCGDALAFELLNPLTSEQEIANLVLLGYAQNQQNFLPEAECLWLRRFAEDSAYVYIKSIGIDERLLPWLEQQQQWHEELFKRIQEGENEEACETGA